MSPNVQLTTEQREAIEYARSEGGTIHRDGDTFWGPEDLGIDNVKDVFPHKTIDSLVRAGVMRYTNCVHVGRKSVPIEAQLIEAAA